MRHTVPSVPPPQQRHHEPIQRSTSITVCKQPHLTTIHSSALSSLRKVFITESARNKLSSSHHALNSLLFALDGYPTATEDPAEIEETARTGTIGGGTGSGRERRDWVTGDPLFPSGRLYFSSSSERTERISSTACLSGCHQHRGSLPRQREQWWQLCGSWDCT